MTTGRDRYLAERVSTASPEQLIMMLLDRAVAELQLAQQDLTNGDRLAAAPHLRRAQDIVGELRCSLDLTVGDIATHLDELYRFAYRELVEAGLDGEATRVAGVVTILEPLRSGWSEACCNAVPTQL